MKRELIAILRDVPLFSGLDEDQLARLAESAVVDEHPAGIEIFSVGEPAECFLLVLSGGVKVYVLSPDGREHVLHVAGPGELVAEGAVFAQRTYPASAMTTQRATKVAHFYRTRMLELLREDPELALAMIGALSRRLREFVQTIGDLSLRDVTARLARFLLENAMDGVCRLPGTKTLLAARLGTVLEPLSRSFRRLKDEGIIDESKEGVMILDQKRLQALVDGL